MREEGARPSERLIEHGEVTTASLGDGEHPEVPESWLADVAMVAPPNRVVSLARRRLPDGDGYDQRASIAAPAGSRYVFDLDLPKRPTLRLAWAAGAPEGREGESWSLAFRAAVESDGGSPVEVSQGTVTSRDRLAGWNEATVSLGRWAGRHVRLALETSGDPLPWGAWANPIVDAGPSARPNLILISVDTVRADHLGAYGYRRRPTTPRLDRFAADNIRFAWAIAQAPWTQPSHQAMLSGIYPASRGELERVYLARVLWHAGYRTLALTGGGQVDVRFGFDRGFEAFRLSDWIHAPEETVRWTASRTSGPFFLFLHTYEVHEPYTHDEFARALPPGRLGTTFSKDLWQHMGKVFTEEEMAYIEALYDGDLRYTDEKLGQWFEAAARAGWLDNSIIVVTSDHGEQFWEHATWGHGQSLHDHQLHVPLLVHLPPSVRARLGARALAPGSVVADQVQLIDLYPTLLELLQIPAESRVQGTSVVPLLAGEAMAPREAFAERTNVRAYESKALRTLRYKFIYSFPRRETALDRPPLELFDLRRDPGEQTNLAALQPDVVAGLKERVLAISAGGDLAGDSDENPPLDADLAAKLRALGYLDNGR